MIPSADVRSIRDCGECLYQDDEMGHCRLESFVSVMKDRRTEYMEHLKNNLFFNYTAEYINEQANEKHPCKYHITEMELKELIDSGGIE